jgi:ABC-type lipoprotein release transport system permease subunit
MPVFTYLANSIRSGDRAVPYSLIAGVDLQAVAPAGTRGPGAAPAPPADAGGGAGAIVLNDWAARELQVSPGDRVQVEFYLWDAAAGLRTSSVSFTLRAIVPIQGLAADRRLAPEYPGITSAGSLADWDPPFPLDLSRVRKEDEEYWDRYRTTPKAFIAYERARDLWSTRYGRLTGLRFEVAAEDDPGTVAESLRNGLRERVSPASQGLQATPSRRLALEASTGATNFGEYFTYFSFFIVVSALLLTVLFFRLGVEGRLRQIGILRATGFTAAAIRTLLLAEGLALATAGSAIGAAGAVGYAHLIVYGLTTWWIGAVGTRLLDVHVSAPAVLAGAAGGTVAAVACVLLSLRAVARRSPRALLGAQSLEEPAAGGPRPSGRAARLASVRTLLGLCLLTLGFLSPGRQAGAFFAAGAALLVACLLWLSSWLRARDTRAVSGRGIPALSRLGFRGAAFRPARSVLSAALVAAATFILVSVDAFRRGGTEITTDPRSGTGGYALLAQSEIPIVHYPDEPAGREILTMDTPGLAGVRIARFRMRPGEDASCLNLYRPGTPTIVAPEQDFIDSGRFRFARSLAATDAERANPWLLLRRGAEDGIVPVVADATSLQYVLHASVGDTMAMEIGAAAPLVVRFVGALRDSVLQGELIMGEEHFVRLFPGQEGFRFFLVDAPGVTTRDQASQLAEAIERALEPFGVDAISTAERLDGFHRVENTYLSTFQALGGLGLLLGTIGLATVMFRNVLERRRELALLRAVGYDARHVSVMILAETALLLGSGVLAGAACALLAIAPAWIDRGSAPGAGLLALLAAVLAAGLVSAAAATRAALSGQLLQALRAE